MNCIDWQIDVWPNILSVLFISTSVASSSLSSGKWWWHLYKMRSFQIHKEGKRDNFGINDCVYGHSRAKRNINEHWTATTTHKHVRSDLPFIWFSFIMVFSPISAMENRNKIVIVSEKIYKMTRTSVIPCSNCLSLSSLHQRAHVGAEHTGIHTTRSHLQLYMMGCCAWSSPLAFSNAPTQTTHTHTHTTLTRNFIKQKHNTSPRPWFLLCARVHELFFLPNPNNGSWFSVWQSFSFRLHTVCTCAPATDLPIFFGEMLNWLHD